MPILRLRRNISSARVSCQYCACAETSPQPGDHVNTAPAQKHLLSQGIMSILRLRKNISSARGSCQYCACAETPPQSGDHANTAPAQKHLLSYSNNTAASNGRDANSTAGMLTKEKNVSDSMEISNSRDANNIRNVSQHMLGEKPETARTKQQQGY
jgi:hypothetical protein